MSTRVNELTGSMKNIEQDDNELYYPGIKSCISFTAVAPDKLVGMHLTIANKRDFDTALKKFKDLCKSNMTAIYIVGALDDWEGFSFASVLTQFPFVFYYNTSTHKYVDLKVSRGNRGISANISWKPEKSDDSEYSEIKATDIKPLLRDAAA